MACDVKLSGGWIIDGSGGPRVRGDVALSADRIDAVGDLRQLEARETIDCTDRILAPGFIDIHSHADFLMPGVDSSARLEPFLRQGMTTLVGGNCGFSPAPSRTAIAVPSARARASSPTIRSSRAGRRWRSSSMRSPRRRCRCMSPNWSGTAASAPP